MPHTASSSFGFSSATATLPIERTSAHVGTPVELSELIKEALHWCG